MRNPILILACLFSLTLFAKQDAIVIRKQTKMIEGNPINGLEAKVKGDKEEIIKFWQDYMKDNYSVNFKEGGKYMESIDVNVASVFSGPVNLYTFIEQGAKDVSVTFVYDRDNKDYMDTKLVMSELKKAENLMKNFVAQYSIRNIDERLYTLKKEMRDIKIRASKIDDEGQKKKKKLSKVFYYTGKADAKDQKILAELDELKAERDALFKKYDKNLQELKETEALMKSLNVKK